MLNAEVAEAQSRGLTQRENSTGEDFSAASMQDINLANSCRRKMAWTTQTSDRVWTTTICTFKVAARSAFFELMCSRTYLTALRSA